MGVLTVNESFDYSFFEGSSCAFGVFDGLHLGHQYLIAEAVRTRPEGGASLAITFDIDPDEVFHPKRLQKLMSNEQRIEALAESGVDDVVILPFTEDLYTKEPEEFLLSTFCAGVPAHMHVGEDFRFGARARGTVESLRAWGDSAGCTVHAHHLVSSDGLPITATRIRMLLADGKIKEAGRLLGHPLI